MTAIMRLPSPAYVIQRTLEPDSVSQRNPDRWPTAVQIVEDLEHAGWRLVPGRRPSSRSNEESAPLMVEGKISSQQLIDYAAAFDRLDEDVFDASTFVYWLVAEVRGSPEFQYLERKATR